MNGAPFSEGAPANASRGELMSALFAGMVMQQTNMALMFLGQVPHPESGQHVHDLEAARMFIDQLEMLETKTKGNLDPREEALLKRSLTALRMAFVEVANEKGAATEQKSAKPGTPSGAAAPGSPPGPAVSAAEPASPPDEEAESRRKFSKKY